MKKGTKPMFKRLIFGTVATAAISVAAVAYTVVKNRRNSKKDNAEVDDEIHFVEISDETEKVQEPEYSDEAKEVASVYPYLDLAFIASLLAKDDEFNKEYPEDTLVNVAHKASFKDADGAKSFVDIMDPAGYECAVSENEVVAKRQFFTEPGAIISDVLNVANQAKALEGSYIDYTINA